MSADGISKLLKHEERLVINRLLHASRLQSSVSTARAPVCQHRPPHTPPTIITHPSTPPTHQLLLKAAASNLIMVLGSLPLDFQSGEVQGMPQISSSYQGFFEVKPEKKTVPAPANFFGADSELPVLLPPQSASHISRPQSAAVHGTSGMANVRNQRPETGSLARRQVSQQGRPMGSTAPQPARAPALRPLTARASRSTAPLARLQHPIAPPAAAPPTTPVRTTPKRRVRMSTSIESDQPLPPVSSLMATREEGTPRVSMRVPKRVSIRSSGVGEGESSHGQSSPGQSSHEQSSQGASIDHELPADRPRHGGVPLLTTTSHYTAADFCYRVATSDSTSLSAY